MYLFSALDDGIVLYPVYSLLFLAHGLTPSAISGLFAIWTLTGLFAEVPTGVLADRCSRRRLLAGAQLVRAAGFALWVSLPGYPSFAAGFVLWGIGGALTSGTLEALVFDELAAFGAEHRYPAISGRAGTARLLGIAVTTALAVPVLAVGGYPLAGALSVAACLAAAAVATRFPQAPAVLEDREPYLATMRAGVREALGRHLVGLVALLAVVVGVTGIEEYFAILAHDDGAAVTLVPLLMLLTVLGEALGSALAGALANAPATAIDAALFAAALALTCGALVHHPAGLAVIAVAMGLLKLSSVLIEARLQARVRGDARATVLSLGALLAELVALAVVGGYAAGSALGASSQVLVALCGVPITAAVLASRRVLRGHVED